MEFQRFTAPDLDALRAEIAGTQVKLSAAEAAGDYVRVVEHSADLGSMLTTARKEHDALNLLQERMHLAEQAAMHEAAGWFWNAYATALQYVGNRVEADLYFAKADSLCRTAGWRWLHSYVLQHSGRNLVEQGNYDQAEVAFQEALSIRQELNDPRRASTERALQALAELRAQHPNAPGPATGVA